MSVLLLDDSYRTDCLHLEHDCIEALLIRRDGLVDADDSVFEFLSDWSTSSRDLHGNHILLKTGKSSSVSLPMQSCNAAEWGSREFCANLWKDFGLNVQSSHFVHDPVSNDDFLLGIIYGDLKPSIFALIKIPDDRGSEVTAGVNDVDVRLLVFGEKSPSERSSVTGTSLNRSSSLTQEKADLMKNWSLTDAGSSLGEGVSASTLVASRKGLLPVGELREGQEILTYQRGYRPIKQITCIDPPDSTMRFPTVEISEEVSECRDCRIGFRQYVKLSRDIGESPRAVPGYKLISQFESKLAIDRSVGMFAIELFQPDFIWTTFGNFASSRMNKILSEEAARDPAHPGQVSQ